MTEERTRMGEAELRMALRGLRKDIEPGNDLWPGIEARLHAQPRQLALAASTPRRGWLWPVATAASVLLAVGVAWQVRPDRPVAEAVPSIAQASSPPEGGVTLVQREADSLVVQYQAAMREISSQPVPTGWQPGLDALDRSALEIRGALQHDPNSRLLLQRLRDTYTRRLALARRALYA